jgi:hypothetical protein
MSQPVVVSVPHNLGRAEAMRRLKSGLGRVDGQFAGLTLTEQTWTDEQFQFRAAAFGQSANGSIAVAEDHVRIEVHLPWFLAAMAEKAKLLMQQHGQRLLTKI